MEEFLKEFGDYYGYPNGPNNIDEIRKTEFKRLDKGVVYLDHAGATLYSELQMEAIFKDFTTNVYGNPHSQSDISSTTSDKITEARQQVLEYFNASPNDYSCIFTSGATAALKLVGETFPWNCHSSFLYTMENHNSVLGIREYALSQGASACAVDLEGAAQHLGHVLGSETSVKVKYHPVQKRDISGLHEKEPTDDVCNLFAFPSECNFSGLRFNLDLVKLIKEKSETVLQGSPVCRSGRWMVLIDAAKGCATQPPDLSKFPADFVVLSFYKLFGYPTGLGALIVRNDAAKLLKKTYFGGGTVAASIADIDFFKRREKVEEFFEDGSASFLSIASISHGFKILKSLTTTAIWLHTSSLAMYVKKKLLALRHGNGTHVCVLYGSKTLELSLHESGPTVTFNLKRPDGSWFGCREVEKLASLSGIQLRTGCFCNPGACSKFLGLSHSDLLSNLEAGHICWDDNDVINGKPTGAVRVSFGYMSTYEEAKKFIDFIISLFVSSPEKYENGFSARGRSAQLSVKHQGREEYFPSYHLKSIIIYPIKSCAGFSVDCWPLCRKGLLHDREWMLQGLIGEILTQKKVPEMSLINTFIELDKGILFVESPRCNDKLQIRIKLDSYGFRGEEVDSHPDRCEANEEENKINRWFTEAVGRPCTLLRYSSSTSKRCWNRTRTPGMCRDLEEKLNFPNEAQFLLISEESVADLNRRLITKDEQNRQAHVKVDPYRFRPNLIVSGGKPYAEDEWRTLKIGGNYFTSLGGCNRCQVVNINVQAGQVIKSSEPLATLASYRRTKGKILFGTLLQYNIDDGAQPGLWPMVQVGQEVQPDLDPESN